MNEQHGWDISFPLYQHGDVWRHNTQSDTEVCIGPVASSAVHTLHRIALPRSNTQSSHNQLPTFSTFHPSRGIKGAFLSAMQLLSRHCFEVMSKYLLAAERRTHVLCQVFACSEFSSELRSAELLVHLFDPL